MVIWVQFGFSLFWADFADNFGICDFFAVCRRNFMMVDDMECFSAFDLLFGAIWTGTYALAEMAKLIGK